MQNIRQCVKYLTLCGKSVINKTDILPNAARAINFIPTCSLHLSSTCNINFSKYKSPKVFLEYNKTIFPPQKPGEERRPAVCHVTYNINLIIISNK